MIKRNFLIVLTCLFACISCLSIKPGSVKSGLKYYESFFVGEDGVQYFIKPLEFESANSKEIISIDFVFRQKDTTNSLVTVTYSIISNQMLKQVDTLVISNKITSASMSANKFLFNEKDKHGYISRFSGITTLNDLKGLFNENSWQIKLYYGHNQSPKLFNPSSKKTKKIIDRLHENLFILF